MSENFFSVNTKFSEGKRLNQDQTDHWQDTNRKTFCRMGEGNIEKTHDQVSERLGLPVTSSELQYQSRAAKKRKWNKDRQKTDEYKRSRQFAKMSKDHRMGKVDAKKQHKNGKVPLGESAKSSVKKGKRKAKAPRTCSNCKQVGHTMRGCKLPRNKKHLAVDSVDFDMGVTALADHYGLKVPKIKAPKGFVGINDWI